MKKLFLTLLSVVAVASVSAQPYNLISKDAVNFNLPEISDNIPTFELDNKAFSTRVPDTNLVGDWTFSICDFLLGILPSDEILDIPYKATLMDSAYGKCILFECPTYDPYFTQPPFIGLFDETSNKITFPIASISQFSPYWLFQFPGTWDWDIMNATWEDIEAEYDPQTGILTFPKNTVLGWPALSDPTGQGQIDDFKLYMVYNGLQEGIDGVEGLLDDFNDEPVYYDLLGRKVVNPQKGQIVIEKKGKGSRKLVF